MVSRSKAFQKCLVHPGWQTSTSTAATGTFAALVGKPTKKEQRRCISWAEKGNAKNICMILLLVLLLLHPKTCGQNQWLLAADLELLMEQCVRWWELGAAEVKRFSKSQIHNRCHACHGVPLRAKDKTRPCAFLTNFLQELEKVLQRTFKTSPNSCEIFRTNV